MKIPLFQINSFTSTLFKGNPAAVCLLEEWLPDATLQAIATENNLSETAFLVPQVDSYHLRWFTPTTEVDLCGHATLAAAFVLFSHRLQNLTTISFQTKSGELIVRKSGSLLSMNFPAHSPTLCDPPDNLLNALGVQPVEVLSSDDFLVVYDSEEIVRSITPDSTLLNKIPLRGVIVTSAGGEVDFVSRFFAPKLGITEDPVTGSAHCTLIPYWANKLKKNRLHALQHSKRGGELFCEWQNDRVLISGNGVQFFEGFIHLSLLQR